MIENNFYHIYNRGNNRETIFKEEKNYQYFLKKFDEYLGNLLDVYAYCLMPNHFHFLLKTKPNFRSLNGELRFTNSNGQITNSKNIQSKNSEISFAEVYTKAFKDFFICYSKSINNSYNRTGSLFQPKFKRKIITDSNHLLGIFPYIHNNPFRAGLVKRNEDWIFSSYLDYLNDKIEIDKANFVYSLYGSKEKFIEFHKDYSDYQKQRDYLF